MSGTMSRGDRDTGTTRSATRTLTESVPNKDRTRSANNITARRTGLDAETAFALWRKIAGPSPGLFIPSSIKAETITVGPWMLVHIKDSELRATNNPSAEYLARLRAIISIDAIGNLALINNYLLDAPNKKETHERLTYYLTPATLDAINKHAAEHPILAPNMLVVFHRIGCLTNIKLQLALWDQRAPDATIAVTDIGELALLTNDIIKKEPPDDQGDPDLVLEFLANWDLTNTADIAHGMARTDRMLRDHLFGNNPKITTLRDRLGIDLQHLDGCTLAEHYALTFTIYAFMAPAVREHGACMVSIEHVKENLHIDPAKVDAFFNAHSKTPEEFQASITRELRDGETLDDAIKRDEFLMDTRVFRGAPFLRTDAQSCLLLDLGYLIELSTAGVYWHYWHQLGQGGQRDLSDVWGHVFESYCGALLEHYYPAMSGLLRRNVTYDLDGTAPEVDAIIDIGATVILFECKASKLKTEDIRSRQHDKVVKDITKKYVGNTGGPPKGVGQLVRDAQAIVRGNIKRPQPTIPVYVYPVLVSDEPLLQSLGVNRRLNEIFRAQLDDDCKPSVRPLTVMSIEELEMVLPQVTRRQPSWQYLLGSRFDGEHVRDTSVYQALWDQWNQHEIPRWRNEFVLRRWEALFEEMRPLLPDEETVPPATPTP
jgi:hypothetical protein